MMRILLLLLAVSSSLLAGCALIEERLAATDRQVQSAAFFAEAGDVFRHPRCSNCHPGTDMPLQGDSQRQHQPLVVRGKADAGIPGLLCISCHGEGNFATARMPGAPSWKLAPRAAGFKDKDNGAICRQIKDPAQNGGKSVAEMVNHLENDKLVIWAWNPGEGRAPAPGTHADFVARIQAWADTGAHCPS